MAEPSVITNAVARGAEQGSMLSASGASALGQTLLWLLVVIGLILAMAWIARRLGGLQFQSTAGIKTLSVLAVGNKERIALIQAGDKHLLIGIAQGRISTLHVFDEPIEGLTADNQNPRAFQDILKTALARKLS